MKKSFKFTLLFVITLFNIAISQNKIIDNQLIIPSSIQLKKPFEIKNIKHFPDNELFVFDKQGVLIYHTEYYNNDWDGKKEDGREVVLDELCYFVFDDGRGTVHTGYIQVIR